MFPRRVTSIPPTTCSVLMGSLVGWYYGFHTCFGKHQYQLPKKTSLLQSYDIYMSMIDGSTQPPTCLAEALALFSPVASIFTFLAAMVYEHGGTGTLKIDLLQGWGNGALGSGKLKGSLSLSLSLSAIECIQYTYVTCTF